MHRPEQHPRHQPGQRDVSSRRYGPTVGNLSEIGGPPIDHPRQQQVKSCRPEHPAQRANQGINGSPQGIKHAARQCGLRDLLGSDAEEQAHEHPVDDEMYCQGMPEYVGMIPEGMEMHQFLIPVLAHVGRDQTQHNAGNQGQGEFLQEVDHPQHRVQMFGSLSVHGLLVFLR